uniref:Heat shock protein DnaJ domain-containing protein (DNAJB6) n=1 Tax=uncultured marine thaumarchaeote KM3_86_E11 TaxID=1456321 RepID=A0A075HUJ7_9ARCH|nr:heat shock protein DnaJ domain-containing protein (DNAJB6) [uncultured marine thaumarchaeote KM3_86_E11]
MKYKVAICFLIIFVLFLPIDVFANSVNISVDLPIYTDVDVIAIHGNISAETMLQITIIDPDEIIVLNENLTIIPGDFTYNITLGNYDLKRSGHYDISIFYDGIKIADKFFYDSGYNVNPMKVSNGVNSLSESDQITIFAIAAIIIIGVLIFLARGSFTRKKTEYDAGEWESKKNRDYEKYHSEWMSDEVNFERAGKDKLSDEEFRESLLNENLPDYYTILQISKNASQNEIKKQFRLLAKKWHPDKKQSNDAEEKMAQINMAYEVLSDHKRRKMYDQYFTKK